VPTAGLHERRGVRHEHGLAAHRRRGRGPPAGQPEPHCRPGQADPPVNGDAIDGDKRRQRSVLADRLRLRRPERRGPARTFEDLVEGHPQGPEGREPGGARCRGFALTRSDFWTYDAPRLAVAGATDTRTYTAPVAAGTSSVLIDLSSVGPVTYGNFSFDISGELAVSDPDTLDSESLLGRMVTLEVAQLVRN